MKSFAFLALTLALMGTPVLAQNAPKQTPENAHRFLATVVENHGLSVEFATNGTFNVGKWSGWHERRVEVSGRYSVEPFKSTIYSGSKCVGEFNWPSLPHNATLKDLTFDYGDINNNDPSTAGRATKMDDLWKSMVLVVDFTKLPGIAHQDYSKEIILAGLARITAPTPELATRVHFALEFLRNACDKTADTGF